MNGIEIFIDESGDFGKFDERCPYYIVTMVFHESTENLFEKIQELEYRLAVLGLAEHCIHSSPAIRSEDGYRGMDVQKRRKVLSHLLAFIHKSNLKYKCFFARKGKGATEADILTALHAEIDPFVEANFERLASYGTITVSYDRGQRQISQLIGETLEKRFSNVRVTTTLPIHSRLSQVADFACTMKKIAYKREQNGGLAKSETVFFGSDKYFRQFWLKSLLRHEWC